MSQRAKTLFKPPNRERVLMKRKLSLKDLHLSGKKVLLRVDFNVPLDKNGHITDDTRIQASLPSIQYILDHDGSVILMSHLGRPKEGKDPKLSLKPCATRLSELLKRPVQMADDCVGPEVEKKVSQIKPGDILLLENLRFHPGEEKPEKYPEFVKQLAKLGDLYVNDAFGTAHRAHASTATIAQYFPGKAASGFLLEKEIQFLGSALLNPTHPFYAIIGGAKISSKIGVLKSLIKKADGLLIGGGMAYTFFKAKGIQIGNSIHEDEFLQTAREFMEDCKKANKTLLLPIDIVVAEKIEPNAKTKLIEAQQGIPPGFEGVDIGPKTIASFTTQLQDAKTIFWNGPLGVFEQKEFAKGTEAIAKAVAQSKAVTVVGGGDSIAAIESAGVANKITHISTGGGAALEYIEFGKLPGIEALSDFT